MTVYISGKITGDDNYLKKFADAELELRAKGYNVINPCDLCYPFLSYDQFLQVDFALISCCDAIYLLKDWEDSNGAKLELEYAKFKGKEVLYENNNKE